MRSQLSGHWISSNWVGNVVVLFQFSKLRGGGRRQDTGGKWCVFIMQQRDNRRKTSSLGPARAWRRHTLPCRRRIVWISVLLCHASDQKTWEETLDFCLQTRGLEYICYNHSYFFFFWRVWAQCLENMSGSFLQLTLLCHRTMFGEEKRYSILYR